MQKILSYKLENDLLFDDESQRRSNYYEENDDNEKFNSKDENFGNLREKIPTKILEFFSIFVNFVSLLVIKSNLGK